MLVDDAKIIFKAGHGGPGRVSFYPKAKSGPDGGNGGKGGDVYIEATSDLMALRQFTVEKTIKAEDGKPGGSFVKSGHNGADVKVLIPVGSHIQVEDSDEEYELTKPGETIRIAKGGLGGKGNYELRSSRNTTPMTAQPGLPGEEKRITVTLKLIADYGLIGLPNAGKSSLLNELTKAQAKVGSYPFTTLEPNLGVLDGKIIADIPGLIEGASAGKGLGIKFLKHIEKTNRLLHLIAADSENFKKDYLVVKNELKKYNSELAEKEEVIIITKTDLIDEKDLEKKVKSLSKIGHKIFLVSVYNWDQISKLRDHLK